MPHYVEVVLPLPLQQSFTYAITQQQAGVLQMGMRVAVPFGKRKIYTGIVLSTHQTPPDVYEAKPIEQLLDEFATINPVQLNHWQWIADYYMCSLGEVVRAALPKAFLLESESIIYANTEADLTTAKVTDEEYLVVEALQKQSSLSIADITAIIDKKNAMPLLNRLIEKGIVMVKEKIYEAYKPKIIKYVRLNKTYANEDNLKALLKDLARAHRQREVVMHLFQLQGSVKPIKTKELIEKSGCAPTTIKTLVDKGILRELQLREDRAAQVDYAQVMRSFELSPHQHKALQSITGAFKDHKPALLFGVTSSGKTEVYIKVIETYIAKRKQVLYLVPEIALTSQLIVRLQHYFKDSVSVYHSKYSINERVEVWNNVNRQVGKAKIIIGARSALLLPFTNLGLIIVDEEHEASFKQFDPAPRYHARDSALVLAKMHGANCLLGSATPSLESYKNTLEGKYGLAQMTERFGKVSLPKIIPIDLKEATRKKKMKGHFSEQLIAAIGETLRDGQQIILFQNRRGFSPIVECTTCGHAERCPNCDVGLTFHQYKNQLRCHYCGYNEVMKPFCKVCGSTAIDKLGFGTEQVQEEVEKLFPKATVGRMDLDTTRGKYAYQKIISAFEAHKVDILVGTQMVTKGLDFKNVGLVGVLNADALLNFPDYRAHERSFQLLTQVAGRAGRSAIQGKVLIQTYNPFHKVIAQVAANDYGQLFVQQLIEREKFAYPPVVRLIKLTLKSKDFNRLNEASAWVVNALRLVLKNDILGPVEPVVSRIKNEYLRNVLIKIPNGQSPSKTKKSIKRVQKSFDAIGMFRSVRVVYDVDHM